jgi:hypothetical protein
MTKVKVFAMATDPRFEIEPAEYSGAQERRSKWASCLIGCLVVLGVLMVVGIFVAVWVGRNWRDWLASASSQAINQALNESELPQPEKAEVKQQVDRVTKAFRDGRISMEQTGKIIEKVMKSPLMPAIVVAAVDKQYIAKSGLSEDEKAQGRVTLKRFTRGLIDEKIKEAGFDAVMSHVADAQPNGGWEAREKVTDEDVRAALAEAKSQADAAGIPEEPENFDPSDEFKKIIDEELKEPEAEQMPK